MINPASLALQKRTVFFVATLLLIGLGMFSYQHLGRLEDPSFTIKTALVVTPYPGASPAEVEEEVTDRIEEAIQSMGQVKEIHSISEESSSLVYVDIKDEYNSSELPQIWDELRRKIRDVQGTLPPGAGPSSVNDDFGDVYGLFFALTGEGYSYAQLKDYAEEIKKELLLCPDVAKIDFWGLQQEVLYVEFQRARLAELKLSPEAVARMLTSQNQVQQSGKVEVGERYLRITPTGDFTSEAFIENLYIGGSEGLVRLGDVATVTRGYGEPPRNTMYFDGKRAIGMGISTIAGGNVVSMGEAVRKRLAELESQRPLGMELVPVYYQSSMVMKSVNAFVVNLVEAVVIVVGLLMLFMGWQSGLLIGFILVLTILATFIGMLLLDIDLQKVSLGALILALGMLVDNAIVVADGILVRVERGESREEAARQVVRDTQMPLLGATAVAILAFGAIGFSKGNVGEFCYSLFQVMGISLSLSWVLAVTVTPLLCVKYLRIPDLGEEADPYDKPMYRMYRKMVHSCLRYRYLSLGTVGILLVLAVVGFGHIPQAFFPGGTQPYFYVNYWRPQGTHIKHTAKDIREIQALVREIPGVKNVTSFVGEGALRFILTYNYETPNSSYGQLLVEVEDYREIENMLYTVEGYLRNSFPDAEAHCTRFKSGPSNEYTVEARFRGPRVEVLQDLAARAEEIMRNTPNARDVRTDWRHPVMVVRPEFAEGRARRGGSTRNELTDSLEWTFNGKRLGLFREGNELIPILARPVEKERLSAENIENVQVWNAFNQTYLPFQQVVTRVGSVWENPLIQRRNRQKTITVQCNPVTGLAEPLRRSMAEKIEALELPPGYTMEWAGEYADSQEAQDPLKLSFPLCLGGMFFLLVCLFNSVRRPVIIFLTVPLAIIGVSAGLLLTQKPFGFMAILGFLGLSGMLIKNAIVLIDQIELDIREGKAPYQAILDAAVSRLRPVLMAAGTTILGMAPLVTDPLYASMAVTIMGGLFGATFLTLMVVPLLYTLLFRIVPEEKYL